jgi:hypothetical protein
MLRQFSGLWILFFAANAAMQEFRHGRHTLAAVLALIALTLGPLGLWRPAVVEPIFKGWIRLSAPIGALVSRVILGIIFYGLFAPIAWIFRIIGRDSLCLASRPAAQTYWQAKPEAAPSRYLRPF